jgi:hypothetical protein
MPCAVPLACPLPGEDVNLEVESAMFCSSCGAQCEGNQPLCENCRGVKQGKAERGNLNFLLALAVGFGFAAAYSYLMFTFLFGELPNRVKTSLTEALLYAGLGGAAFLNTLCVMMKWRFTIVRVALVATLVAGIFAIWVSARFGGPPTYAVTGQLLADGSNGSQPVVGADVYFFPTVYANEPEYLTQLEQSEWGAIVKDQTISAWKSCSEQFYSVIRQNTGLAGPLDAKFYPIKSLWYAIKNHRLLGTRSGDETGDRREILAKKRRERF